MKLMCMPWFLLFTLVLVLDGNKENIAHKKQQKIEFDPAVDVTIFLEETKLSIS